MELKSPIGAEKTGARLGRFAYRLSKSHRLKADRNLRLAFPELTDGARDNLALLVMEHFGRVMAYFTRSEKRTNEEILSVVVESEGMGIFDQAVSQGKGILFVTAHFGNWELLGTYLAARGYNVMMVEREANDPALHALTLRLRTKSGLKVISRGKAAMNMLGHLRAGGIIGVLPDQNSAEVFVPFFGHPCGTVQGPAVIAMRAGVPIHPVYCWRIGPNQYRIEVEQALNPEEGFSEIEGMTRAINKSLENVIRKAPDQYLWIHDRWKSARQRGLVP